MESPVHPPGLEHHQSSTGVKNIISLDSHIVDIVVDKVSISFSGQNKDNSSPMLSDLTYTWSSGKKILICGQSGRGKSTFLQLLEKVEQNWIQINF